MKPITRLRIGLLLSFTSGALLALPLLLNFSRLSAALLLFGCMVLIAYSTGITFGTLKEKDDGTKV